MDNLFFVRNTNIFINKGAKPFQNVLRLFEKFGYSGNGNCWESFIKYILNKKYPAALNYMDFNSESDMFTCEIDNEDEALKIVFILNDVFSNNNLLENYIKIVDRQEIDD